jgi:YVTN family beta-propeller protein
MVEMKPKKSPGWSTHDLLTLVAALLAAVLGANSAAAQRKAYVTNEASNNVSVIDANPQSPTFNTVLTTVNVGMGPRPLGISPSGA